MPRAAQPAARRVASVERALAVLGALADSEGELGTNEIARRTGINASSVSRLLATLAEAGFVEQVAATGRYRLGIRLLQLGNSVLARLDLREVARPELHALAEATGETATLSAPGEHDAVTVDFVSSTSSVRSVAQLGRPSVGHATATGKVLLAFGNARLPAGALTAYTERTLTSRRAVAGEIERVRKRGFAQSIGEREQDLNAIAAPIWSGGGGLAGILGVQGPASRFGPKEMEAALERLLEAAATLSIALGWSPAV